MEENTRREFLQNLSFLLVGSIPIVSLFNGCALTGLVSYRAKSSNGIVALDVGSILELSEIGNAIQLDGENFSDSIIIAKLNEHNFIALSSICSHLGCTVRKEGSFFRCPCHGSTYSLNGNVVKGPAEEQLKIFQTEFSNGKLTIHL